MSRRSILNFRPIEHPKTIASPVIPVRVRQAVPAIQVAGARIRAVPEVTGDQAALQVLPLAPNERATDLFYNKLRTYLSWNLVIG